jgi:hypothetical protein
VGVDRSILSKIEESMLYTKKAKLSDLLSIGIAISHDTIDNSKYEVKEIKIIGK